MKKNVRIAVVGVIVAAAAALMWLAQFTNLVLDAMIKAIKLGFLR